MNVTIRNCKLLLTAVVSSLPFFGIPGAGEKEKNLPLSRAKSTINLDRAMLRKAF